jgi:molybdopterin molybdotransferase
MSLMPVEEARARILKGAATLGVEKMRLVAADGLVLAEDIAATRTQPPFAASAMDGYAVRAADVASVPVDLKVTGEIPAGFVHDGTLGAGEALRIFTGAPLPEGADSIVIQENTDRDGDVVTVKQVANKGDHIRPAGMDFAKGDILLKAGTLLSPRHLALAAAMNHAALPVHRRPRIGVLATGDELVLPGEEPGPGQIISSNSIGIAAFVENCGGIPIDLGIARDTADSLAQRIAKARAEKVDILVTLGGASVGDHDLVMQALEDEGMTLDFWRIAMRPGKPLIYGRLGDIHVMGLPGNPVSAQVCARVFLLPLILALLGRDPEEGHARMARAGTALKANTLRQHYMRAQLTFSETGDLIATPFSEQDSSMLALLARADCLIVRPPDVPAANEGDAVQIIGLDSV